MNLNNQIKRHIEQSFNTPVKKVYHYTSSLNEIIRSRYLKFSSHDFLNDRDNRELEASRDLIISHMEKRELLVAVVQVFREYLARGIKIYTVSFCEIQNYDYAKKKYGEECISFKKKFLTRIQTSGAPLILAQVKYNPVEQRQVISKIFKLYEKSNEANKLATLFLWLSITLPLFKENQDRYDKECRIVSAEIFDRHNGTLITQECPKTVEFNLNEVTY
ncbi:TPA: hypothetical protein ACPSKB_002970 [Legionella feeleii]